MNANVTLSNRRVRTRTHGGVAGVSGQPLPLCRSNAQTGKVPYHEFGVDSVRLGRYNPDSRRKPMSLKRHFAIVSFTLLLSQALYPCSIVVIGGYIPSAVGQLSGTVVG